MLTYADVCSQVLADSAVCGVCVLMLPHMCPHTAMCPHRAMYRETTSAHVAAASCCYKCVRILLYVLILLHVCQQTGPREEWSKWPICPHTATYVSSYYYMCASKRGQEKSGPSGRIRVSIKHSGNATNDEIARVRALLPSILETLPKSEQNVAKQVYFSCFHPFFFAFHL